MPTSDSRPRAVTMSPLPCSAALLGVTLLLAVSLGWSRRAIHLGEPAAVGGITVKPPAGWIERPAEPIGSGPGRRFDSTDRGGGLRVLLVDRLGPARRATPTRLAKFVISTLISRDSAFPDLLPLDGRPLSRPFGPVEGIRAVDVSNTIAVATGVLGGEGYSVALVAISSPLALSQLTPRDFATIDAVAASIEQSR